MGRRQRYRPNEIPLKERILCCVLSLILVVYGIVAYKLGKLYIPARHGGAEFQGIPMYLMLAAMAFATLAMLLILVDHYDQRDNERYYRFISRIVQGIAWTFFFGSIIWDVVWK
jgi:hypothetical protein